MELFLSTGIGHLYSERLGMGITKLIISVLFCVLYGILKYYLSSDTKTDILWTNPENGNQPEVEKYLGGMFCCMCCGLFVWQIVDLVMFGVNAYNDGNGIPLASW